MSWGGKSKPVNRTQQFAYQKKSTKPNPVQKEDSKREDENSTPSPQIVTQNINNTSVVSNDFDVSHCVIYSMYVRNHCGKGTFQDAILDLPRIRSIGVDVLWLLPIHPIGKKNKKGSLGCPYSISNFREINPEYGSMKDFEAFVEACRSLNLRVMIDVVFRHTSHDCVYAIQHPEWYLRNEQGEPMCKVPKWTDVVDLILDEGTPHCESLWTELIDVLKFWATKGVEGFRCDVATMVPVAFWKRAKEAVAQINPQVIWLAESGMPGTIAKTRREGTTICGIVEMHEAFDMTYDYESYPVWHASLLGKVHPQRFLEMNRLQEAFFPAKAVKLRFVENHDVSRIMEIAPSREQAIAWTCFCAFNSGAFLIHGGQEDEATHKPSLFQVDMIKWNSHSLQPLLACLCQLKKEDCVRNGVFTIISHQNVITASWQGTNGGLFGIFNVEATKEELVEARLNDGTYQDVLSGTIVVVKGGKTQTPTTAAIVKFTGNLNHKPFYSPLMNF